MKRRKKNKRKTILKTNDTGMSGKGEQLHDVDNQIMEAAATGQGTPIESAEQLMDLAKQAQARHREFKTAYAFVAMNNPKIYDFVRELRADKGCSWRAVAQGCYDKYEMVREFQQPPSNQLAGIAICEIAAEHFGENSREKPWN